MANKIQDIKEHMEVLGADGKSDPQSGGQHRLIPIDWVDHIDAHVHLSKPAKDAIAQWQAAA
jgi:hypothetical protein